MNPIRFFHQLVRGGGNRFEPVKVFSPKRGQTFLTHEFSLQLLRGEGIQTHVVVLELSGSNVHINQCNIK